MKQKHQFKLLCWKKELPEKLYFDQIKKFWGYCKEKMYNLVFFDNFLYLVIGILLATAACFCVKDYWGFYHAAPISVVFLLLMIKMKDYKWMGKVGYFLIAFAIISFFTSIFGNGVGWHLLGFLAGVVVFFVVFLIDNVFFPKASIDDYSLGIWLSTFIIAFMLLFVQGGILSAEENRLLAEKEKQFDKQLVEAPWQIPKKHIIETRCGTTYHVLVMPQDTLDLSVCEYPEIRYMDENSQIKYVLSPDKKLQRLEIR